MPCVPPHPAALFRASRAKPVSRHETVQRQSPDLHCHRPRHRRGGTGLGIHLLAALEFRAGPRHADHPVPDPAGRAGRTGGVFRLLRALPGHLALRLHPRHAAHRPVGGGVGHHHPHPAAAAAQRPGRAPLHLLPRPAAAHPLHVHRAPALPLVEGKGHGHQGRRTPARHPAGRGQHRPLAHRRPQPQPVLVRHRRAGRQPQQGRPTAGRRAHPGQLGAARTDRPRQQLQARRAGRGRHQPRHPPPRVRDVRTRPHQAARHPRRAGADERAGQGLADPLCGRGRPAGPRPRQPRHRWPAPHDRGQVRTGHRRRRLHRLRTLPPDRPLQAGRADHLRAERIRPLPHHRRPETHLPAAEGRPRRRRHQGPRPPRRNLRAPPAGHRLPRRRLQARSHPGRKQRLAGRAQQRPRHPHAGRRGGPLRHRTLRLHLQRQGGEPHQRHGRHQAAGRDDPAVPAQHGHPAHGARALRQRAGLQRQRHPQVPRTDRQRRPRHRHPPRHHPLFHVHPRGHPARAAGRPDGTRWRDLRARHGPAHPHRGPGPHHGAPVRLHRGRDPHRLHRPAPGRETLRGAAGRQRKDTPHPAPQTARLPPHRPARHQLGHLGAPLAGIERFGG